MRYRILLIVVLLLGAVPLLPAASIQGMWVVRYALNDGRQTRALVRMAGQLGLTDLYVQVWAKGRFLMQYTDPAAQIADTDRVNNNLKELISQAHQQGIKVHAWLNVLNIWSGSQKPERADHLYYSAKKSLLRPAGSRLLPPFQSLSAKGVDGYFLEPLNSENQRLLGVLVKRLLDDYAVDGIHLDYFRFPGGNILFSPEGRSAYMMKNYFDPLQFFQSKPAGLLNLSQRLFGQRQYKAFQKANMERLLKNLQQQVRECRPDAVFSVAVKADIHQARSMYLQDWPGWLHKGLCDYVVLMNYVPAFNRFNDNLTAAQKESPAQQLVIGISTYNQPLTDVALKIRQVRSNPFKGYTLFSFNDLQKKKNTAILADTNKE